MSLTKVKKSFYKCSRTKALFPKASWTIFWCSSLHATSSELHERRKSLELALFHLLCFVWADCSRMAAQKEEKLWSFILFEAARLRTMSQISNFLFSSQSSSKWRAHLKIRLAHTTISKIRTDKNVMTSNFQICLWSALGRQNYFEFMKTPCLDLLYHVTKAHEKYAVLPKFNVRGMQRL